LPGEPAKDQFLEWGSCHGHRLDHAVRSKTQQAIGGDSVTRAEPARLPDRLNGNVPAPIQCKAAPEAKAPKDIFSDADANKDGKLSLDEFNKAYALIVAQEKAKAARPAPPLPKLPGGGGIIENCPLCGLG
jgi:hypothetical protein